MVHHGGRGTVLAAVVIEPTRAILSRFSPVFLPKSNTRRKMAPFRLPALD